MDTSDRNDQLSDDVMTAKQVAELLQIDLQTVYLKANAGEIPGMFRIGEGERVPMRFSKQILMDWIANHSTKL